MSGTEPISMRMPTYGGYSTAVAADDSYVLRIPQGLLLGAHVTLLSCAENKRADALRLRRNDDFATRVMRRSSKRMQGDSISISRR
ncbi:MAG TPA: hypothetical protein VJQ82_21035 [Terriglobales bacterium]|nr:hypothetical protein [Terriglobales bacterium]